MGFGEAIKVNFSKYATFSGRASRSEFWWWVLFTNLVSVGLTLLESVTNLRIGESTTDIMVGDQVVPFVNSGFGVLSTLWALAILIPTLAVSVRRLHDADHSGWWLLWGFLLTFACCVGAIILFIFYVTGSKPANRWGPPAGTA